MKLLNGSELAGFIKERQAKQVSALRQAHYVFPRLAIVQTVDNPVINKYVELKKRYGADILIDVVHVMTDEQNIKAELERLNDDPSVHGIIVQLPLNDSTKTDEILNLVAPQKDVDGLGVNAKLDPATPIAINWLLTGYGVDLTGKRIAIVGQGRLVGAPLAKMWQASGYEVHTYNRSSDSLKAELKKAQVIVSAAGAPGLITSDKVAPDTVVVDAGTADENGRIKGDIADDLRSRSDLTITPERGGVGPLTVCALFDNVIRAASLK